METSEERWLPVPGFEGHHEVSDQGRVRSVDRYVEHHRAEGSRMHVQPGRILKPNSRGGRYLQVALKKDAGTRRTEKIGVLVLEAFVGPRPNPRMQCRHLNDVKTDNRLANLAWGTRAENARDAMRNGVDYGLFNSSKTHCPYGHPYAGDNLIIRPDGARTCRACRNARANRYYHEKRAQ